ncbi:MAG: hypothetical protein ACLQDC_12995 [Verrucomicrobiia bacterium]
MHYVLLAVEKPKSHTNLDEWNQWQPFLDAIREKPELTAGAQSLAENVWLFPLDNGLKALAECLHLLQVRGLAYKYFVTDTEPEIFPLAAPSQVSPPSQGNIVYKSPN